MGDDGYNYFTVESKYAWVSDIHTHPDVNKSLSVTTSRGYLHICDDVPWLCWSLVAWGRLVRFKYVHTSGPLALPLVIFDDASPLHWDWWGGVG